MSRIGTIYGEALYSLAKEAGQDHIIGEQLTLLNECFQREPEFLRLLSVPDLPKTERCQILDDCFRGRIVPYLLNFLKLLTEKGHFSHIHSCTDVYIRRYHQEQGILSVTATTSLPLTPSQKRKLIRKLQLMTGKKIRMHNAVEPSCLGGVRLDYGGIRIDGTVARRLESIRSLLTKDIL